MKNKKLLLIPIVILLLIIIGITLYFVFDNSYDRKVSIGESFKVPLLRSVKIKDEGLTIRLLSTEDSRCREGTQCIWQGELGYKIKVNNETFKLGTVKNTEVEYKGYVIKLDDNDSTKYVVLTVNNKLSSKSKDNKNNLSLDDVIKVNLYETVSVGDLEIELYSVDDSRCPVGVNCYWEGELEYSLDVNGKTMKLGTVQKKEDIYGNYKIMLNEKNDSTQYVLLEIKER